MTKIQKSSKAAPTPFAQSALALDADFEDLERLSSQLGRLELDSEGNLEKAREKLADFSAASLRIGESMQNLARNLDESRARAERAVALVAERAQEIRTQLEARDALAGRFQTLGEMVKKISLAVANLNKPASGNLSDAERAALIRSLPEISEKIGVLENEASKLREEARAKHLKTLERNADSLSQSLHSVRGKLGNLAEAKKHPGSFSVH